MIRNVSTRLALLTAVSIFASVVVAGGPALAKSKHHKKDDAQEESSDEKGKKDDKSAKANPNKPAEIASYNEWGVFVSGAGKGKTCYALVKPKSREPSSLKRDDGYVFISNRPGENVHNEVSIIVGFPIKDSSEPHAEVGSAHFALVPKGANAWLKNPAEEGQFIDAIKKGGKLVVHASSTKGKASVDTYALAGVGEALSRVRKECP